MVAKRRPSFLWKLYLLYLGWFRVIFFFIMMRYVVCTQWGNSNENTQHTFIRETQRDIPIIPPFLAPWLTLVSSDYPWLDHLFMVPKVLEPLKLDCSLHDPIVRILWHFGTQMLSVVKLRFFFSSGNLRATAREKARLKASSIRSSSRVRWVKKGTWVRACYKHRTRFIPLDRSRVNPLYNDIPDNSKIRKNVNSVCTKISGLCIYSLTVPCYSLGEHTFLIFVRIASLRRF